jgi:hypothetical protein
MGARSAVNKKKQTMLYPWLLPMNIVDTIFDVRGLCDDGFRRQERAREPGSALPCCAGVLALHLFLSAAWRPPLLFLFLPFLLFYYEVMVCLYRQGPRKVLGAYTFVSILMLTKYLACMEYSRMRCSSFYFLLHVRWESLNLVFACAAD